jgi:hypothetical protein
MSLYVYTYACMYVKTHLYIYIYIHILIYIYMYINDIGIALPPVSNKVLENAIASKKHECFLLLMTGNRHIYLVINVFKEVVYLVSSYCLCLSCTPYII